MNQDDLITAMAKARWESLAGGARWDEVSAEVQWQSREDLRASAEAVVAFVADWLEAEVDYSGDVASLKWRKAMQGES